MARILSSNIQEGKGGQTQSYNPMKLSPEWVLTGRGYKGAGEGRKREGDWRNRRERGERGKKKGEKGE